MTFPTSPPNGGEHTDRNGVKWSNSNGIWIKQSSAAAVSYFSEVPLLASDPLPLTFSTPFLINDLVSPSAAYFWDPNSSAYETFDPSGAAVAPFLVEAGSTSQAANTAPTTMNFSTPLQEGDIVILALATDGNAITPLPAGYTLLRNEAAATVAAMAYYKVMGAVPDTSIVTDLTSVNRRTAHAYAVFRGVDPVTPFDNGVEQVNGTQPLAVIAGHTTTVDAVTMVNVCFTDDDNIGAVVSPAGWTFDLEQSAGGANGEDAAIIIHHKVFDTPTTFPNEDFAIANFSDYRLSISFGLRPIV